MSTIFFVLTLNFLGMFNSHYAFSVRPPECSGFPTGCVCTTQNLTDYEGGSEKEYTTSLNCDGIGLREVPDLSKHPRMSTM